MPDSGKTTCAKALARGGLVRLSVDDQMTALHGRIGKEHAEYEHLAVQAPVIEAVRRQLVSPLREGRSAVLDHGLGTRAARDDYKQLVADNGARWRLSTSRLIATSCCGDRRRRAGPSARRTPQAREAVRHRPASLRGRRRPAEGASCCSQALESASVKSLCDS
ncbi:AAA family ATPase [Streptomyces sp. NPDC055749]